MRRAALLAVLVAILAPSASAGGARALGTITIGRIGLKMTYYAGTTEAILALGPGHYAGTVFPGAGYGTVAIAGHRVTPVGGRPYGPFRFLDRVRRGDIITLTNMKGKTFKYRMLYEQTVPADDDLPLNRAYQHETLILTTCTPPHSASYRLDLIATRVK